MSKANSDAQSGSRKLPPWNHTYEDLIANFPSGKTPREAQVTSFRKIDAAFRNGKTVAVVEMPTGGGKSLVAKSMGDVVAPEGGAYMITAQRALQDQYEHEFRPPELEVMKGRSNYGCTHPDARTDMHAGKAVCHDLNKSILEDCVDENVADPFIGHDDDGNQKGLLLAATHLELPPAAHHCPYWKQLQICNDSKLTLFNFSSFLFQRRMGRFQKRALLLVDEGHNIEGQLLNFVTVELTERTLGIIGITIDRQISSKAQLTEWLRETELRHLIEVTLDALDKDDTVDRSMRQVEKDALTELKGKLEVFMEYLDKAEWIIETVRYKTRNGMANKIQARPLYVNPFAHDLLFSHADRVIVFSATILNMPLWAKNLNIKPEDVEHIQTPCEFPVENRPVHLEFCGNMGRKHFTRDANPKDPTQPKFVAKVKQLLKRHEGQRGLIHCHSFALSKVLREEVRSKRFLFQADFGGDKQLMMSALASVENAVIVAPAMSEGFDFKDDLARFQIIAKIPWPSLGDKVIKERAARDDVYFGWLTCLKLIQSYGRIVRSKNDWGYSYIIDSGFKSFYGRHSKMLPGWFQEAVSRYAPKNLRTA